MTRQLWAPWRLAYVQSAHAGAAEEDGCFLCRALDEPDEPALVVHRAPEATVLLNRFPYSSGHLLVAPRRHVGAFGDLTDAEALAIHRLAAQGMEALAAVFRPDGYNLGWNMGRVAGAGLPGHAHLHVVPRWEGDHNFMPVLADVKVMPEHLDLTRSKLAAAWPG
jgi:ATP adenylyltransferase